MPDYNPGAGRHWSNLDKIVSLDIPGTANPPTVEALGLQALAADGVLSFGWGGDNNYQPSSRTTIGIAHRAPYPYHRAQFLNRLHLANIPRAMEATHGVLAALDMSVSINPIAPLPENPEESSMLNIVSDLRPREIRMEHVRYLLKPSALAATAIVTGAVALGRATVPILAYQWRNLEPVPFTEE